MNCSECCVSANSKSVTLRLTVSQFVLVSSPIWDLWADTSSCLIVTVLSMLGVSLDERTVLSFVRVIVSSNVSYRNVQYIYVSQVIKCKCKARLHQLSSVTYTEFVAVLRRGRITFCQLLKHRLSGNMCLCFHWQQLWNRCLGEDTLPPASKKRKSY
jgi:hypothetical protein